MEEKKHRFHQLIQLSYKQNLQRKRRSVCFQYFLTPNEETEYIYNDDLNCYIISYLRNTETTHFRRQNIVRRVIKLL